MPGLNIAILCHAGMGGSGILGTTLALRLVERGHQVHLFATRHPYRIQRVVDNLKLHIVDVPQFEMLAYPPEIMCLTGRLEKIAKQVPFDIIHSHFLIPFGLSAEVARQVQGLPSKLVVTLHGTDVTQLGRVPDLHCSAMWALQRADAITCVSNALKEAALETFSRYLTIDTIYNFLPERHAPISREERIMMRNHLGLDAQEFVLVHASNFRTIKRVEDIVDAFHQVRQRHPCKLVLFGEGPQWASIRSRITRLGLNADVRLPGKVRQCARWLGIGDLGIQLSQEESFGLVLLETLSQGVPMLASRVGGMPEVVQDGINGLLCQPCQPDEAARLVEKVIEDPQLHQQLADNAIPSVAPFAEEDIVAQYEGLYRRLLGD